MGLIAQRWSGETRSRGDWLNDDEYEPGTATSSGVRVTRNVALGLTTIWRCWDLLSSAVAQAPKDIVVKVGGQSFPERTKPSWLVTPNPADPNYTANDYFAQVALSLLADGNFFTHVFPHVFDPQVLTVLDPRRVRVKPGPKYEVLDEYGKVKFTGTPADILHGTWIKMPSELRAVSPLEALRRGIGSAIAAEDHAARFFGQGAALSFGVEVPYTMDAVKKETFKAGLRNAYSGLKNSHAIGVLTDGAKFVSGLAPTPEQAQMLDTRKFSVEDLCRPYGVPPAMAGSSEPGASSYASDEVKDKQFAERAVLPLAIRIEKPHERLLEVPAGINDPSASVQFRINLDGVARVNVLTRMQAYSAGVQGGILTPNYARGKEDLPPLEGGDLLYMQSQMLPITLLAKPPAPPPPPTPAPAEPRFVVNNNLPETRSEIHNHLPATEVRNEVSVQPTTVQVHPTPVNVEAPVVHNVVEPAPVQVDVHVPEPKSVKRTVERDSAGRIIGLTDGE